MKENTFIIDKTNPNVVLMEVKHPETKHTTYIKFDIIDFERISNVYWRQLNTGRIVDSKNTTSLHLFIPNVTRNTHFVEFKNEKYINYCQENLIVTQRNTYKPIQLDGKDCIQIEVRSNLNDIENPKIITIDKIDENVVNSYIWHVWDGYACTNPGANTTRDRIKMSRLIKRDELKSLSSDFVVDHINFDRLDNRRLNLQVVTNNYNNCKRNPIKDVNDARKRTGVYLSEIKGRSPRWVAIYRCPDTGTIRQKYFSTSVYGEEEAERLAHQFRNTYPVY